MCREAKDGILSEEEASIFLFESRTIKVGELGYVRIALGFWM